MKQGGRFIVSEPVRAVFNGVYGAVRGNDYSIKDDFRQQGKTFQAGWKSLWSEKNYGAIIQGIEADPLFREAVKMGVQFSVAGKVGTGENVGEEQLNSGLVEKIATYSNWFIAPLYAKAIGRFDASMAGTLDALRMMMYSRMSGQLKKEGLTPENNKQEFEAIAREVTRGTGRANKVEKAPAVQKIIDGITATRLPFATSYTVSHFQVIGADVKNAVSAVGNLVTLKGLPKGAQKAMLARAAYSYGTLTVAYTLAASALGAAISFDPDDDDFLKLKWGKYRYDATFGLRGELRFIFKMMRDAYQGNRVPNEMIYDMFTNIGRYTRNKLNVAPAFALDALYGKDALGQNVDLKDWMTWAKLLVPITWGNLPQSYKEDGAMGVFLTLPEAVGIGSNVYPDRAEEAKTEAEKLALKIKQMGKPWFNPREFDMTIDNDTWKIISDLKARSRKGEDVSAELKILQDKGTINQQIFDDVISAQDKSMLEGLVADAKMDEKQIEALIKVANDDEKIILQEMIEKKRETKEKTLENENNKEAVIDLVLEMNKLPANSREELRAREAEITRRLEKLKQSGVIEISDYAKIRQRINLGETRATMEIDAARSPEKVIQIFEKAFQKADEKEKQKLIKKLEEKRNNAKDQDNRFKYSNVLNKYNPKPASNKPIFQGRESDNVVDVRKFARRPS